MSKIYVASSWKNQIFPSVVLRLDLLGHEVYDFKNPPNKSAFSWKEIDENYERGKKIDALAYRKMLETPQALRGYLSDMSALRDADIVLLCLPAGRSASWEYGWACASAKKCGVIWFEDDEPDLMFKGTEILANYEELDKFVGKVDKTMAKNCSACRYSGMEPADMNLTCGHPDAGVFGLHIKQEPLPHCKDFKKFEQHPGRNPNGTLKFGR